MKKLLMLSFLLLAGCSHTMLSREGKSYERVVKGMPLICAVVNEWDVSTVRPDGNKKGCWCRLPPIVIPGVGATMVFQMVKDELCQEGELQLDPPFRKSSFKKEEGI